MNKKVSIWYEKDAERGSEDPILEEIRKKVRIFLENSRLENQGDTYEVVSVDAVKQNRGFKWSKPEKDT